MAMSVSSSVVRAAIAADMVTAWDAQAIHFSQALTPLSQEEFDNVDGSSVAVRAFVIVPEAQPEPSSFSKAVTTFPIRLTGIFKFPASDSGEVLQDVKETNADALIALLTAQGRYVGGKRRVTAVRYSDVPASERLQSYFEVEIDFEWRDSTDL